MTDIRHFFACIIQFILKLFYGNKEPPIMPRKSKKYDTTRFTQKHYDFIMECYAEFLAYNKGRKRSDKKTQKELVDILNEKMDLDKSVKPYARIWRGQVKREDLPPGDQHFSL